MNSVNNDSLVKYEQHVAKSQKYFNAEAFKNVLEKNLLPLAQLRLSDYKQGLKSRNAQEELKTIGETIQLINQRLASEYPGKKKSALLEIRGKLVSEAVNIKKGYIAKVEQQWRITRWLTSGSSRIYRINELCKQAIGYNTTTEGCNNIQEALNKQTAKFTKTYEALKNFKKGGEKRYQLHKAVEQEKYALEKLCKAFRADSSFSPRDALQQATLAKVLEAEKVMLEYDLFTTNHSIVVRKRVGLERPSEQKRLQSLKKSKLENELALVKSKIRLIPHRDGVVDINLFKRRDELTKLLVGKAPAREDASELTREIYESLGVTSVNTDGVMQAELEKALITHKDAMENAFHVADTAVKKLHLASTLEEFHKQESEASMRLVMMTLLQSEFRKLELPSTLNTQEKKLVEECQKIALRIRDISVNRSLHSESLDKRKSELVVQGLVQHIPLEPTKASEFPLVTLAAPKAEDWQMDFWVRIQEPQGRRTYEKSSNGVQELHELQKSVKLFEQYVANRAPSLRTEWVDFEVRKEFPLDSI